MQIFFRVFFIFILLATAFGASLFMILESASYYRLFYSDNEKVDFALWLSILNEVFLIIMAAVWLPAIQKGEKKIFHPGNLLIKLLLFLLFITTVGGASLNVIHNKLKDLQEQKNRIAALKIRESQIQDYQNNLQTFVKQNQKLNTVLASKEVQNVKNELIELQSKQQSSFTIWIEIFLLFILRFTIQLSNVTAVWLSSWLYRQPLNQSGIFHPSNRKQLVEEYQSTFTPQLSLNVKESKEENKTKKEIQTKNEANLHQNLQQNTLATIEVQHNKNKSQFKPVQRTELIIQSEKSIDKIDQTEKVNQQSKNSIDKIDQTEKVDQQPQTLIVENHDDNIENQTNLIQEINAVLNELSPIDQQEFLRQIGSSKKEIEDIANPQNFNINKKKLENLHHKIILISQQQKEQSY